jgi:hypothetical protein
LTLSEAQATLRHRVVTTRPSERSTVADTDKQQEQADQKRQKQQRQQQQQQEQQQASQEQEQEQSPQAQQQQDDGEGARSADEREGPEQVTEAEAGVQREDPEFDEQRAGLATGSQAANPHQPDRSVIQTTTVPLAPEEPSHSDLSVLVDSEGNDGPAVEHREALAKDRED